MRFSAKGVYYIILYCGKWQARELVAQNYIFHCIIRSSFGVAKKYAIVTLTVIKGAIK